MIICETPRLVLRELTVEDVPAVAALYADPIVMGPKGGVRPYGYAEHTVRECIHDYERHGFSFWAVMHREEQRLIGLCGLLDQEIEGKREVEIAYVFAKEYWGQGLATEAARACKEYGCRELEVWRFVSLIAPENVPSQRVALKLGMVHERNFVDEKGRYERIYAVEV